MRYLEQKREQRREKHSLVAPAPPRVGGGGRPCIGNPNPNLERLGRVYGVWETQAVHTQ